MDPAAKRGVPFPPMNEAVSSPVAPPERTGPGGHAAIAYALLVAAVLAVYANALPAGFVGDDQTGASLAIGACRLARPGRPNCASEGRAQRAGTGASVARRAGTIRDAHRRDGEEFL